MTNAAYAIGRISDGHRANQAAAADAEPRLIMLLLHANVGVANTAAAAIGRVCDGHRALPIDMPSLAPPPRAPQPIQ